MPQPVGSTTVSAASMALPPAIIIAMPACEAKGWDVAMTSRP